MEDARNDLDGLGGWLIVVGFGLVLGIILVVGGMLPLYVSMFTDGGYESLTTPGSQIYHPLWAPALIFEMTATAIMLAAQVSLCCLFITKNRLFPTVFIVTTSANLVVMAITAVFMLGIDRALGKEGLTDLMKVSVSALIWIPYMVRSKRVKATFTRSWSDPKSQPEEQEPPATDAA